MPQKESAIEFAIKPLNKQWSKAACLDYIHDLSWSPNGHFLACADAKGIVSIHSVITRYVQAQWTAHCLGALRARWSHDGKHLASAGQDGKVHIHDCTEYERVASIDHGNAWVEHIAWNQTKDIILTAAGKQLKLSQADGRLIQQFEDHKNTIADIAWNPVVPELFATSSYGGTRLWNVKQVTFKRFFDWKGSLLNIAYSPNGKVLAAGCQDGAAHIWLLPSGDDLFMNGYPTKVRELSWDSSSRYLATGGGPEVIIWDFSGKGPSGSTPIVFPGHDSFISTLKFSPTSLKLASGGLDGRVMVWDLNNQDTVFVDEGDSEVSDLVWNPTGDSIAAAYSSGHISVFNVE
jgi:WD40 repeat protein